MLSVLVALVAAAVLACALAAGCGGDDSAARDYIQKAKDKSEKVALGEEQLRRKGEELSDFFNAITNITPETAEVMKKFFSDLVVLVTKINEAAQETRAEYEKILELDDVADFKKYANNRIKALELINRRSELVKQFAAIYDTVVDQALNNQPIDEELIRKQTLPILEERNKTTGELDKLNQEAEELARKLNIE